MCEVSVHGRWARFNGTTWPMSDAVLGEDNSIEWVLRYGTPTREQLLVAASYIHAYGHLVNTSESKRREVVRNLKFAQKVAASQEVNG